MSFYFYEPFEDFENTLFNHPYYAYNPHSNNKQNQKKNMNATKKGSTNPFDKDVYKLVDFCPRFDLGEDEKNFYIQLDLPEMTKEQIHMELSEDNTLIISGERVKKPNEIKYTKMDCQYGKFSRSFSIPETANLDKIEAKMENGVLEVTIPKAEPPKNQRRTIQIQ